MATRRGRAAWAGLLLGLGVAGAATGQEISAALKDRVAQLVEKLGAKDAAERDAAEKALIALGARALPVLPVAGEAPDDDANGRLKRIREALESPADEGLSNEPTRVTLKAQGMRLSEVLRELQKQTGNRITDLRESYGQDATNPALDLELEAVPFLQALDQVAKQAGLTPTFFTGDGTVGLTAGGMYGAEETTEGRAEPIRQYSGPFRIELKQYATQFDFASGARSANAQLEIDWEPRLRPMLLSLAAGDVEIVDDQGRKIEPMVTDESGTVVLRPENPAAEMNLNMTPPERSAQKLGTLKVKANITVPAKNQVFRFPNLAESGAVREQGPVKMKLLSTEIDEFVWKVDVEVSYGDQQEGEGAFETYRQGLFNNRIWLQRADGSRFEHNGGFNQTGESGTTLRFQYLFVDAPGKPADYQLVYETPTMIEAVPVEFTFKDIPLP